MEKRLTLPPHVSSRITIAVYQRVLSYENNYIRTITIIQYNLGETQRSILPPLPDHLINLNHFSYCQDTGGAMTTAWNNTIKTLQRTCVDGERG
jgi:hypothetical protein